MHTALSPQVVHQHLAKSFNDRDLDALMSLYEVSPILVAEPGKSVSGEAAVREALAGYLALQPRETFVKTLAVVQADDLALTRSTWGLVGTGADGIVFPLKHRGIEVMQRRRDGSWRFLIDDPFAGDNAQPSPIAISTSGSDQPADLHARLARAFNQNDLQALSVLYEEQASLVPEPGRVVTGKASVQGALSGLLSLKPREFEIRTLGVVIAGDVALTRSHWSMRGTHPEQGALVLEHDGVEIMRRDPQNGRWRFLVDDPFAGDRE